MKWTKEKLDKSLSMAKQGISYKVISDEIGIKMGTIRTRLNRMGIKNTDYRELKKNIITKCLNCDNEIVGKKFCNTSCSAIFNNKKRGERTEIEKNNIKIGIIKSMGYVSLEDWMESKNIVNKDHFCKKCGEKICIRPDVCRNFINKFKK